MLSVRTTGLKMIVAMSVPLMVATVAGGQSYEFTIDRNASSLNTTASISAPLSGTFLGDYDPQTNPSGTQTRPGAFGGSGNNPIPYTATLTADGAAATQPAGAFAAALDLPALEVDISGLAVDLLNGQTPSSDATLAITFSTFHTVNPDAIFPGASDLPVPIGEFVIEAMTLQQSGPSQAGSLTPQLDSTYLFSVLVPVDVTLAGNAGGEVIDGTISITVLIQGVITLNEDGGASLTAQIDLQVLETDTGPFDPIVDQPFDVPTILPPGEIAHLLLSGEVQSITTVLDLSASLAAGGAAEPATPGDLNGDGSVNVLDLLIVLGEWGLCAGCDADLNGDDVVDVLDLLALLSNWG